MGYTQGPSGFGAVCDGCGKICRLIYENAFAAINAAIKNHRWARDEAYALLCRECQKKGQD